LAPGVAGDEVLERCGERGGARHRPVDMLIAQDLPADRHPLGVAFGVVHGQPFYAPARYAASAAATKLADDPRYSVGSSASSSSPAVIPASATSGASSSTSRSARSPATARVLACATTSWAAVRPSSGDSREATRSAIGKPP